MNEISFKNIKISVSVTTVNKINTLHFRGDLFYCWRIFIYKEYLTEVYFFPFVYRLSEDDYHFAYLADEDAKELAIVPPDYGMSNKSFIFYLSLLFYAVKK